MFMPNELIDNNEIFKIIGPAFSMIIGAFVGAFATMMGMIPLPYKLLAIGALLIGVFFYGYMKGSAYAEAELARLDEMYIL